MHLPSGMALFVATVIWIVVFFIEMGFLAGRWNRRYCTTGWALYERQVDGAGPLANLSLQELARRSSTRRTQMRFHRLGPDLIVFRRTPTIGAFRSAAMMRGVIRWDLDRQSVVVVGLLNWFILAANIVAVPLMFRDILWFGPLLVIAFLYGIWTEGWYFKRVIAALREQMSALPAPAHHEPQLAQP